MVKFFLLSICLCVFFLFIFPFFAKIIGKKENKKKLKITKKNGKQKTVKNLKNQSSKCSRKKPKSENEKK